MPIVDTDEPDSDDPDLGGGEMPTVGSNSTLSTPPVAEIAAAFPQSFLQQERASAGPANPPKLRERKRGKGLTLDQAKLAGVLHALQGVVTSLQELLPAAGGADEAEERPAAVARHVRFADELEAKQQSSQAERGQQLAKELARLRRQYNISNDKSDSKGIHDLMNISRGSKLYTLDRMLNADVATGFSLVLANGKVVLLPRTCWDTGASMSLIDLQTCKRYGIRYRPTTIRLTLANGKAGTVVGITEPIWGVFALGTPHEAKVMVIALVIDGVGPVFQFIGGKDIQHAADVSVRPKQQVIEYDTAAGGRHSLPIAGYEMDQYAHLLMTHLVAGANSAAASNQVKQYTVTACAGLVDFSALEGCVPDAYSPTETTEAAVAFPSSTAVAECQLSALPSIQMSDQPALAAIPFPAAPANPSRHTEDGDLSPRPEGAAPYTTQAALMSPWLRLELHYLTLGGDETVTIRFIYPADFPSTLEHATGPAAAVAGGLGCSKETLPASEVPPDHTAAVAGGFTVGDLLRDAGYVPQHWFYQQVARFCSFLMGICCFFGSMVWHFGISLTAFNWVDFQAWFTHVLLPWHRALLSQLVHWAAGPGDFQDPSGHYMHRSRKKGKVPWQIRYWTCYNKGQLLPASVLRQLKRYTLAFRLWRWQSNTAMCVRAALHTGRFTFSTSRVLLILILVTYCAAATATPDGVQMLQVLTGNLAAWELSRLARCNFR